MKKPERECKRWMAGYNRGGDALRFATNKLNRGGYNVHSIGKWEVAARDRGRQMGLRRAKGKWDIGG